MNKATLNHSIGKERLYSPTQGLAAVKHNQQPSLTTETTLVETLHQILANFIVFRASQFEIQNMLIATGGDPQGNDGRLIATQLQTVGNRPVKYILALLVV